MKVLLFLILTVLCWPLGLLIAAVWIPWKILVLTGKVTASTGRGFKRLLPEPVEHTVHIKPKDHWHSIDTPVGLLEKRKPA